MPSSGCSEGDRDDQGILWWIGDLHVSTHSGGGMNRQFENYAGSFFRATADLRLSWCWNRSSILAVAGNLMKREFALPIGAAAPEKSELTLCAQCCQSSCRRSNGSYRSGTAIPWVHRHSILRLRGPHSLAHSSHCIRTICCGSGSFAGRAVRGTRLITTFLRS